MWIFLSFFKAMVLNTLLRFHCLSSLFPFILVLPFFLFPLVEATVRKLSNQYLILFGWIDESVACYKLQMKTTNCSSRKSEEEQASPRLITTWSYNSYSSYKPWLTIMSEPGHNVGKDNAALRQDWFTVNLHSFCRNCINIFASFSGKHLSEEG